jgi:hypothetical protein
MPNMSNLTPSQETRECLARGGFEITEQGTQSARHAGRKSLTVGIDKALATLSLSDLLLVSIIADDLNLDYERKHSKLDVFQAAQKAHIKSFEGTRAVYQQPNKALSTIGRKFVTLRNINGLLAKYDIRAGKIV